MLWLGGQRSENASRRVRAQPIPTPFVSVPGLLTAECVANEKGSYLAVTVHGNPSGQPMMFAHGFGCDQTMWRHVWPAFAADYRIFLFDYVVLGGSDLSAYDAERYSSLDGYALDVLEIIAELELDSVVFVGHLVSAMIGVLASLAEPGLFDRLVLVGQEGPKLRW